MQYALSYKVWESTIMTGPRLRLPKHIDVDNNDRRWISMIKWSDISWENIGGDGDSIYWLEMKLPLDTDISDGVVVDVQVIKNTLNQIHIDLTEDLRGLGLGTNIYISLIHELGHIYSSKRRRLNPLIDKLIDTLSKRSDIIHVKNDLGDLLVSKHFNMGNQLVDYFKAI